MPKLTLETSIDVQAPASRLWQVLTQWDRYSLWNPFIQRIQGELKVGAVLQVTVCPPGGRAMSFRPRLQCLEAERELRWLGHAGLPGLFDGAHRFELEPMGEKGVRLIHSETFSGLLLPFFKRTLEGPSRAGFEAMNQAFKRRCESSDL